MLDLLRERYFGKETAVAEPIRGAPAVADPPAVEGQASAVADPMNDLDDVGPEVKPIQKTRHRKRLTGNVPVCLTMPKRPPCTGAEQDDVVQVHVPLHPGGHRSMFLRMDNIDWLLAYGADEHHFQGIERAPPHEEPAVADEP